MKERYIFDACFNEYTAQSLFNTYVHKNIHNCVSVGQTFTLFLYGQTGSGKTYLIFGKKEPKIDGILDLCLKFLYSGTLEVFKVEFKLNVQQYYDGKVLNMLNNTDDLKIPTLDAALKNINNALKKRISGVTSGNDKSSRSW